MPRIKSGRPRGRPPHPGLLTPAEERVLAHLRDGLSNPEIAARLGVSPDAVKFHVSHMLAKLDLPDRHALAAWPPGPSGVGERSWPVATFVLALRRGASAVRGAIRRATPLVVRSLPLAVPLALALAIAGLLVTVIGHLDRSGGAPAAPGEMRVVWDRALGGDGEDVATAIAAAADGSVYVAGWTAGPRFGGESNAGGRDAFLSRLDAAGNVVWTRLLGGPDEDRGYAVAVTADGAIYLAGSTEGPLPDGRAMAGEAVAFLARYTAAGDREWVSVLQGDGRAAATGVVTAPGGEVYVVGRAGGARLEGEPLAGLTDLLVAGFTSDGDRQWLRIIGGSGVDQANGVARGGDGSLYVVGASNSEGLVGQALAREVGQAVLLLKLTVAGDTAWVRSFRLPRKASGDAVAVSPDGSAYVTGGFGHKPPVSDCMGDCLDLFLARYSSAGDRLWLDVVPGFTFEAGAALVPAGGGGIHVVGFTGGEDFLDGAGLPAPGGSSDERDPPAPGGIVVMRYDASGARLAVTRLGNRADVGRGAALVLDGSLYVVGSASLYRRQSANQSDALVFKLN